MGTYAADISFAGGEQTVDGERDGVISGAWFTDLRGDGDLDLIIWMTSVGSGAYGTLALYTQEDGKFSRATLEPLNAEQREGYMGHDAFDVKEGDLIRTFPIYLPGDSNAMPTGGEAGFKYSFEENRWVSHRLR